jgi:uncharacterized membrane protein YdjX (TVP38/TMEM64 family)
MPRRAQRIDDEKQVPLRSTGGEIAVVGNQNANGESPRDDRGFFLPATMLQICPMSQPRRRIFWIVTKPILVAILLAILGAVVWRYNLPFAELREVIQTHTDRLGLALSLGLFVVLYCVISIVPIPGREVFKLVAAVVFGYWSITAVWWGEMAAAVAGFALSRFGGYELVKWFGGERVMVFNDKLQGAGWWAICLLRIVPITPYRFFNFGAGLVDVRFGPYFWGSALGTLVRTAFFQIIFVKFSDVLVTRGVSVRDIFFASILFGGSMILIWLALHRRSRRQGA